MLRWGGADSDVSQQRCRGQSQPRGKEVAAVRHSGTEADVVIVRGSHTSCPVRMWGIAPHSSWRSRPVQDFVHVHDLRLAHGVCSTIRHWSALARHDLDCRRAGTCADHRAEIRAAMVLRPVGIVDEFVDRAVDRLEGDFLRHAGSSDPPRFLPHRGLVPARVLPVVCAA